VCVCVCVCARTHTLNHTGTRYAGTRRCFAREVVLYQEKLFCIYIYICLYTREVVLYQEKLFCIYICLYTREVVLCQEKLFCRHIYICTREGVLQEKVFCIKRSCSVYIYAIYKRSCSRREVFLYKLPPFSLRVGV